MAAAAWLSENKILGRNCPQKQNGARENGHGGSVEETCIEASYQLSLACRQPKT